MSAYSSLSLHFGTGDKRETQEAYMAFRSMMMGAASFETRHHHTNLVAVLRDRYHACTLPKSELLTDPEPPGAAPKQLRAAQSSLEQPRAAQKNSKQRKAAGDTCAAELSWQLMQVVDPDKEEQRDHPAHVQHPHDSLRP